MSGMGAVTVLCSSVKALCSATFARGVVGAVLNRLESTTDHPKWDDHQPPGASEFDVFALFRG